MRASILAASLAIVGYASAQGLADSLTPCAQECLKPIASSQGIAGCPSLDIKCICENGGFLNTIGCCLQQTCSETEKQAAITFAADICKTVGVTVPNEIPCDAAGVSSSSSATASRASSSAASASSNLSSLASSASSSASAAAESTTAAPASSTATQAATSASSTAAAAAYKVGGSGLVGGIVAALAML